MNNDPIVKVEHLSHRYSVQWAVRDINFEIDNTGIVGLLGSNGAGKSTIMNIICGVLSQTEGKVAIAQLLAPMIREGDTIMVDESSTAAYAVRALRHLRGITLITNSQEMLQEMGRQDSWQIISTGGHLKSDVMALVGPQAVRAIEGYHVRWTLLSCRGLNDKLGIADSSEEIVQVKRAMMRAADTTVLLTDHRKFDRTGFVSLGRLDEVDCLITDQLPTPEWIEMLNQRRVQLICKPEAQGPQAQL